MTKPFKEEEKENWKKIIIEQRSSSLSITSWCHQNCIPPNQFFYWQKKLFPKPLINRDSFAEIVEKENNLAEIKIEYRSFIIRVNHHFKPSLLLSCLEVLKKC